MVFATKRRRPNVAGEVEIQAKELRYEKQIGDGGFATVYLGKCRGTQVAIKKLKQQNPDEKTLKEFLEEAKLISRLRHPNIVMLIGVCVERGNLACVQELLPNGSLTSFLEDTSVDLTLMQKLKIAKDTAVGMNWLHSSFPIIIHRDLKPDNLLLDSNNRVKITDFGISLQKEVGASTEEEISWFGRSLKGTPRYMAPEIIRGKKATPTCDVYAYGIVLWQIITRKRPTWEGEAEKDQQKLLSAIVEGKRPPLDELPKDTPEVIRDLIERCWHASPLERPTFVEILDVLSKLLGPDALIPDQYGATFWKKTFKANEEVKLSKFLEAVCSDKNLVEDSSPTSLPFRCLKALFEDSQKDPPMVSITKFAQICSWLGPLDPEEDDFTFAEKVVDLLRQPYFHGELDPAEVSSRLTGKADGTFLVRFSKTQPGSYTISYLAGGKILHTRIQYTHYAGFSIQAPGTDAKTGQMSVKVYTLETSKLSDFITFLVEEALLDLTNACEGSKYQQVFVELEAEEESTMYTDDSALKAWTQAIARKDSKIDRKTSSLSKTTGEEVLKKTFDGTRSVPTVDSKSKLVRNTDEDQEKDKGKGKENEDDSDSSTKEKDKEKNKEQEKDNVKSKDKEKGKEKKETSKVKKPKEKKDKGKKGKEKEDKNKKGKDKHKSEEKRDKVRSPRFSVQNGKGKDSEEDGETKKKEKGSKTNRKKKEKQDDEVPAVEDEVGTGSLRKKKKNKEKEKEKEEKAKGSVNGGKKTNKGDEKNADAAGEEEVVSPRRKQKHNNSSISSGSKTDAAVLERKASSLSTNSSISSSGSNKSKLHREDSKKHKKADKTKEGKKKKEKGSVRKEREKD